MQCLTCTKETFMINYTFETFTFVFPDRKFRINIFEHLLVSTLCDM